MYTPSKKEKLIEAAAELFHQKGLQATSLADIAARADIAIGNVYYYFKTKEELALAVLEKRRQLMRDTYAAMEEAMPSPRDRLIQAVLLFDKVKEAYTQHGCPIGRAIAESSKADDSITQAAAAVFSDFTRWAGAQFALLGHEKNARVLAESLMTSIQGATLLAKASSDVSVLEQQLTRSVAMIEELPNTKIHLGKVSAA